MRKWFTVLTNFVIVSALAILVFREQTQNLPIRKVTIVKVATGTESLSALLPTDLDGDGKTELLALSGYNPPTLILYPFDRPKTLQLPPPIGDLSDLTPTLRMKRYPTSHLTWFRLEGTMFVQEPFPSQIHGIFEGMEVVDVDGDGVTNDLLVVTYDDTDARLKRWQFALDESGNWQLIGVLPKDIPNGFLSDLDRDGEAEVIRVYKWDTKWRLEIWCFSVNAKQWKLATASQTFEVKVAKGEHAELAGLWVHDLDGDGRKEIIGVWQVGVVMGFACGPLGCRPIVSMSRPANSFIFQWHNNQLTMRNFMRNLVVPVGAQSYLFGQSNKRYFLLPKLRRLLFPLPQLISFNPPRIEWLTEKKRMCTEIWLLPEGKDALEPFKWRRITELPGEPLAVGDWDKDGQVEMFLRSGILGPEFPRAVLARLRDEKVRRAEWNLGRMKSPICALPLVENNKLALFVGWNDGTIEKVEW